MFTGRARPAARWPGQNGSRVWAEVSTSPVMVSASWAATGYTPKSLIPSALTLKEALQSALAPGFRLAAMTNGEPAGTSTVSVPWFWKDSIPSRLVKCSGEVYSCTCRPACVWLVPLLTDPVSVTVAPGPAYRGVIELMATATRPVRPLRTA